MTNQLEEKRDLYTPQRKEHVTLAQIANEAARKIIDFDTLKDAATLLIKIKEKRKLWQEFIAPAVKAAYEAHKRIKDVEKEIDEPLRRAEEEILKPAISKYELEKTEKRKAQEETLSKQTGVQITLPNEVKIDGITFKYNYSADVMDLKSLCRAVAEGSVPEAAVKPNYPFLNSVAKNLKTALNWPGVKILVERVVSARAKSEEEDNGA